MKKGIYILPNSITLCGLFAGFYSMIALFRGDYVASAWGIIFAIVLDGLDGWVARLTHSTTKFGIELDSLADVISFGVAPSLLLYKWSLMPFKRAGWAAVFLFVSCGALRLARYNVQMGSTERKSFTGLPIPGAAAIVATSVMFFSEFEIPHEKSLFMLITTYVISLLMVSTLRFHGLKEIDFGKRKPFWLLVAVALVFAIVWMHPASALFVFAMIYLGVGIIENIYLVLRRKPQQTAGS